MMYVVPVEVPVFFLEDVTVNKEQLIVLVHVVVMLVSMFVESVTVMESQMEIVIVTEM